MNYEEWSSTILADLAEPKQLEKLHSELLEQLTFLSQNYKLIDPYSGNTITFLENTGPQIITKILNTKVTSKNHAEGLNQILIEFIKIISYFMFTKYTKFTKAIYNIVTKSQYEFYDSSSIFNPDSFLTSKYVKTNIDAFLGARYLSTAIKHYSSEINFDLKIANNVVETIEYFKNNWTAINLFKFVEIFLQSYNNYIEHMQGNELRDINEKEALSIFNNLQKITSIDKAPEDLASRVVLSRFNLLRNFVFSEFLAKQSAGLRALMMDSNVTNEQLYLMEKEGLLDQLLKGMHPQVLSGFCWIFKRLLKVDLIPESYIRKFWDTTVNSHSSMTESFLKEWQSIISVIPDTRVGFFWQCVGKTPSFEITILDFLKRNVGLIPSDSKEFIFDHLFNASRFISDEQEKAIAETTILFLPTEESKRHKVQSDCLKMLSRGRNTGMALLCLKKLCKLFNDEESRAFLGTLLNMSASARNCADQYYELIGVVFSRLENPLTYNESSNLLHTIEKIAPKTMDGLLKFVKSENGFNSKIFTLEMKRTFLQIIAGNTSSGPKTANVLNNAFLMLNKERVEEINIPRVDDVTKLDSVNVLWDYLDVTLNESVMDFLCRLYGSCTAANSIPIFIDLCLKEPMKHIRVATLLKLLTLKESLLVQRHSNRFDPDDTRIKVPVTGDINGAVLLESKIEFPKLRQLFADMLISIPKDVRISIDGKPVQDDVLNLTRRSILDVSGGYFYKKPETDILISEMLSKMNIVNKMLPMLECGDKQMEKTLLQLLNFLPASPSLIKELESDEPDWDSILDPKKPSKLAYNLSTIGNMIGTQYANTFYNNNGFETLFNKMLENQEMRMDAKALTVISLALSAHINNDAKEKRYEAISKVAEAIPVMLFKELTDLIDSNPAIAIKYFDLVKAVVATRAESSASEEFVALVEKTLFQENPKFREVIYQIMKNGILSSRRLSPLIEHSNNPYCTEFFRLLAESEATVDRRVWTQLVEFFEAQFPLHGTFEEELFSEVPSKEFLDGSISALAAFKPVARSKDFQLASHIAHNILLNPAHYFAPSQTMFKFLKELSDAAGNNKLAGILSEAHEAFIAQQSIPICQSRNNQAFTGLKNLGMTCYMNTAVQVLFHTTPFRNAVLKANVPEDSWLFELQLLFADMLFSHENVTDPSSLASVWKDFDGNPINVRLQQDSAEFLENVIDRAEDIVKGISQTFRGKITHSIEGIKHNFRSISEEDFTVFSADIENTSNLALALNQFLIPDNFTGNDQYNAEGIGLIDAKRKHVISKSPETLIIHLKRFTYDILNQNRKKITSMVEFPQTLTIESLTNDGKSPKYSLHSIIVHSGTAHSGHYISYINTKHGWYLFNDSNVTPIESFSEIEKTFGSKIHTVESEWGSPVATAYVLIYKSWNEEEVSELSPNIINRLKTKLNYSFRKPLFTSLEYAQFFLNITNNEEQVFEYFTHCLSWSTDIPILEVIKTRLIDGMKDQLADYIVGKKETHYRILLESSSKVMRKEYASILLSAMQVASHPAVDSMMDYFSSLIDKIMNRWQNFDEFFLPFLQYVNAFGSNDRDMLTMFMTFLTETVPNYAKEHANDFSYSSINLSAVFKLLVVLLSSPKTRQSYQSVIFSHAFLDRWFQSAHHSVAFSQLLRPIVLENSELSSSFFNFFSASAPHHSPAAAAGHFSVLISSMSSSTTSHVNWAFDFLQKSTPGYISEFLKALGDQIRESHIDFGAAMISNASIWMVNFLMAPNQNLRKQTKRFAKTVFTTSSAEQRIPQLADELCKRLGVLTKIALKRQQESYSGTVDFENSLPSPEYIALLKWCGRKANIFGHIAPFSLEIVNAMVGHRSLKCKFNVGRHKLLQLVKCLDRHRQRFFSITPPSMFLSAFDGMALDIEKNVQDAIDALQLAMCPGLPTDSNVIMTAENIAQSKIFQSCLSEVICGNEILADQLIILVRKLTFEDTSKIIARDLFGCPNYKSALSRKVQSAFEMTLFLFRQFPATADVFADFRCYQKAEDGALQCHLLVDILREFTDSYVMTNEHAVDWLWRSKIKWLQEFWVHSKLPRSLITKMPEMSAEESASACSLLITIAELSLDHAAFVVRLLADLPSVVNAAPAAALLISIACENAPDRSVDLLIRELSTVKGAIQTMHLRRAAKKVVTIRKALGQTTEDDAKLNEASRQAAQRTK